MPTGAAGKVAIYRPGGTDHVWSAGGLVGWRFGAKRNSAIFLGYRYRNMRYSKAAFKVERTFSGPAIGVGNPQQPAVARVEVEIDRAQLGGTNRKGLEEIVRSLRWRR
jgi:hypothetical protein